MQTSKLWYYTTVLQNVAFGEEMDKVYEISLCYFLQLHVNLQLFQ